ncbi:MAG: ATP-binding domain-containing protein [Deltaproteobacteria bacterium]|nr:ATP-binding domain-containing protein [Deltaproteobacteria bacterium]
MKTKTLSEFYHELIDRTRYVEELRAENTEESLSRIENLQEFDSILVEFEATQKAAIEAAGGEIPNADVLLPHFLESVTLSSEQADGESEAGFVSMMTLHTSKGLEFPLVFIVGCEEGLFPSIRQFEQENEEDIEEERRLCYVGMTRAKRKLFMTHAVCRRVYGNIVYHDPSRFFLEMPDDLVEFTDLSRMRIPGGGAPARGRTNEDDFEYEARQVHDSYTRTAPPAKRDASWDSHVPSFMTPGPAAGTGVPNIGLQVKHGTYGMGIVRGVEGANQDAKVTVEFAGRVVKKFVLKFANLEFMA